MTRWLWLLQLLAWPRWKAANSSARAAVPWDPRAIFHVRSSLLLCHLQVLGTMQTIPVLGRADDLGLQDVHISLAGGEPTLHQFGAVTSGFPLGLWLGSVNCLKGLPVFKSSLPPIQCEQASPV